MRKKEGRRWGRTVREALGRREVGAENARKYGEDLNTYGAAKIQKG